jgi:hypothetical protein
MALTKAKQSKKANELHFSIGYLFLTLVIVYIASQYEIPALRILGSSIQSVSLWLLSVVGFAYFLGTTGTDITHEIVKEYNVALGLLMGLYSIGMAIVIHG